MTNICYAFGVGHASMPRPLPIWLLRPSAVVFRFPIRWFLCVCLRAGPRLLQKALSIEPVGPCLSYPPRQRVCFPSNHRVGLCLLRLLDRVLSPLRPLAENSAKWGVPRPWVASLVRTLTTEIQIFLVRLFATFPARPPEGVMNP